MAAVNMRCYTGNNDRAATGPDVTSHGSTLG
jgi:hypothetical protein